jgi:hypothetical protein
MVGENGRSKGDVDVDGLMNLIWIFFREGEGRV